VAKKYANKFYNHLLALSEANAGFRVNSLHASSISATFYAFQAIETLGKLDEFRKKQSGTYSAALNFVQATQDNETKGFKIHLKVNLLFKLLIMLYDYYEVIMILLYEVFQDFYLLLKHKMVDFYSIQ